METAPSTCLILVHMLLPLSVILPTRDALLLFLAAYLVFFEGMVASSLVTARLCRRPRAGVRRYLLSAASLVALGCLCFVVLQSLYYLPPIRHAGPLSSATPNSFPSHHAFFGALIVALVFIVDQRWALPFAVLTAIEDVALLVRRDHHLADILASTLIVIVTLVSVELITPRRRRRREPRKSLSPVDT